MIVFRFTGGGQAAQGCGLRSRGMRAGVTKQRMLHSSIKNFSFQRSVSVVEMFRGTNGHFFADVDADRIFSSAIQHHNSPPRCGFCMVSINIFCAIEGCSFGHGGDFVGLWFVIIVNNEIEQWISCLALCSHTE